MTQSNGTLQMSRTFNERRTVIGCYKPHKGKEGIVDKKWKTHRKMQPLLAGKRRNFGKYAYVDSGDVYISYKTKAMKLELKNANRSIKKADRQKAKRDIQMFIVYEF